jgi:hypothetical protein
LPTPAMRQLVTKQRDSADRSGLSMCASAGNLPSAKI